MPVRIGYKWLLSLKSGKQFPVFASSYCNFEEKLISSIANVIFLINLFVFALHNQNGLSIKFRNLLMAGFYLAGNSGLKSRYANFVGEIFIYSGNTLAKKVW